MAACSGVAVAAGVAIAAVASLRAAVGAGAAEAWREAVVDGFRAVTARIAVCVAASAVAPLAGVLVAEPADLRGVTGSRAGVGGMAKATKLPDEVFADEFVGLCGAALA